jgi:hypothetical protein
MHGTGEFSRGHGFEFYVKIVVEIKFVGIFELAKEIFLWSLGREVVL